jgi:holo-[acyl-carrier protein] synthase
MADMIKGIGTDIIEVERIAEKIAKGQGFRELVFTASEIEYCEAMAHPNQHYAARFAAKEAFFKAMGTGWANGTAFNEIEITHDAQGKPVMVLTGDTSSWAQSKGVGRMAVSLAHVKELATAVVIIEE